jgi:hypothetical protein
MEDLMPGSIITWVKRELGGTLISICLSSPHGPTNTNTRLFVLGRIALARGKGKREIVLWYHKEALSFGGQCQTIPYSRSLSCSLLKMMTGFTLGSLLQAQSSSMEFRIGKTRYGRREGARLH